MSDLQRLENRFHTATIGIILGFTTFFGVGCSIEPVEEQTKSSNAHRSKEVKLTPVEEQTQSSDAHRPRVGKLTPVDEQTQSSDAHRPQEVKQNETIQRDRAKTLLKEARSSRQKADGLTDAGVRAESRQQALDQATEAGRIFEQIGHWTGVVEAKALRAGVLRESNKGPDALREIEDAMKLYTTKFKAGEKIPILVSIRYEYGYVLHATGEPMLARTQWETGRNEAQKAILAGNLNAADRNWIMSSKSKIETQLGIQTPVADVPVEVAPELKTVHDAIQRAKGHTLAGLAFGNEKVNTVFGLGQQLNQVNIQLEKATNELSNAEQQCQAFYGQEGSQHSMTMARIKRAKAFVSLLKSLTEESKTQIRRMGGQLDLIALRRAVMHNVDITESLLLARQALEICMMILEEAAGHKTSLEQLWHVHDTQEYLNAYLSLVMAFPSRSLRQMEDGSYAPSNELYALLMTWKGSAFVRRAMMLERLGDKNKQQLATMRKLDRELVDELAKPKSNQRDREITEIRRKRDEIDRRLSQEFAALRQMDNQIAELIKRWLANPNPNLDGQLVTIRKQRDEKYPLPELKSVEAVSLLQKRIPADSVLLDFYIFDKYGFEEITDLKNAKNTPDRESEWPKLRTMIAFVVPTQGKPIKMVEFTNLSQIEKVAHEWRQEVLVRNPNRKKDDEPKKAKALSQRICTPLVAALRSHNRILVSPAGVMNGIPIAALPDPDNPAKRLVQRENSEFGIVPAAMLVARKPMGNPQHWPSLDSALLVDAPEFGGAGNFSTDLQPNRDLAEKFVQRWPKTKVLKSKEATKVALLKIGPTVNFIMLRTHHRITPFTENGAGMKKDDAERKRIIRDFFPGVISELALAGANVNPTDGILTGLEVSDWRISASLVVLQACKSGKGDFRTIFGMQQAFQAAGGRAVLGTNWDVDPQETDEVVLSLLNDVPKKRPTRALADAQRAFLARPPDNNNELRQHPYYWGAWTVTDDLTWELVRIQHSHGT